MPTKRKRFHLLLIFSVGYFLAVSIFSIWLQKNKVNLSPHGCQCFDYTGDIDYSITSARYEGKTISIPSLAFINDPQVVLGAVSEEKWIEVDLSDQKLYAWSGSSLFLETKISSGLQWTPTPIGEFRIWTKLRATRMRGGTGKYAYDLPNVPHVMFFENDKIPAWKGYGLHGAYWHNSFGTPRSHGCVNLPLEAAKTLYYWTDPVLSEGKGSVRSTAENVGTRIVIHQ